MSHTIVADKRERDLRMMNAINVRMSRCRIGKVKWKRPAMAAPVLPSTPYVPPLKEDGWRQVIPDWGRPRQNKWWEQNTCQSGGYVPTTTAGDVPQCKRHLA